MIIRTTMQSECCWDKNGSRRKCTACGKNVITYKHARSHLYRCSRLSLYTYNMFVQRLVVLLFLFILVGANPIHQNNR